MNMSSFYKQRDNNKAKQKIMPKEEQKSFKKKKNSIN